jgi:uncharacterized membrane protein YsdA (DUF1294 family)
MTTTVVILYLVTSLIAFALYGLDKSFAKANAHRIPEKTLLLVGLVGGWPGAWIGQQVFRHKTSKPSFRIMFWFTVLANLIGLGLLLSGKLSG